MINEMTNNSINKTKINFYNQKGEGVGLHNNKPIYLPHTILGEEVSFKVIEIKKNYAIGKVEEILQPSDNRVYNLPQNYDYIGGYELIHMKIEEEINYKKYVVTQDFKNIAKYTLKPEEINFFQGKQELRYRNKITLLNGGFQKKNTNEIFYLEDFLLTQIKPQTNLKGKVIFRQLDTLIIGSKADKHLYTTDTMFDLKFRVNINSFYQINKEVAIAAYQKILDFLEPNLPTWDLYAGIGTITLIAAQKVKNIVGVERNKFSFQDALFNIKFNKVDNIEMINQDVEFFLKQQKNFSGQVILDPARDGVGKKTILELLRLEPQKIIYLSCNPATQAYDFKLLSEKYQIKYLEIFNMFPKTYHIENLIVLELKK